MANQWFKFYGGEYLSDPKIERLTPAERSCWVTILCLASMNGTGIIEFLTVESLLNKSGIQPDPYNPGEWENSLAVLLKFEKMKMVKTNEEGIIEVINWKKRQEHNLTVAERVAKHRAKKKANVTTNVTSVTTEESRIDTTTSTKKQNSFNTTDKQIHTNLSWNKILINWRRDGGRVVGEKKLIIKKDKSRWLVDINGTWEIYNSKKHAPTNPRT